MNHLTPIARGKSDKLLRQVDCFNIDVRRAKQIASMQCNGIEGLQTANALDFTPLLDMILLCKVKPNDCDQRRTRLYRVRALNWMVRR